uniref:ladderlectin-like n=1 Tax=Halichoeres trimaculatus TaxID=147232 RepID=UPI003D9E6012
MKMLTAFLLVCAGMALTNAAAFPEVEPDQMMEEAPIQADPEAEPHEEMPEEALLQEDDVLAFSGGCPGGWARYHDRCFLYVGTMKTWALAERHCQALGGNLASVHNDAEDSFIKELIHMVTNEFPRTWIGGSDAQQEGIWLWSDGSRFTFTNWCSGQPNNLSWRQHCIERNFGGKSSPLDHQELRLKTLITKKNRQNTGQCSSKSLRGRRRTQSIWNQQEEVVLLVGN